GTGVKEHKKEDFKYTYNNGKLKIHFVENIIEKPVINIYDISGKLIKTISDTDFQAGHKSIELDVSFLIPGVYLFEISFSNNHYSLKLLVP
ncbi:T9SS type A sorting domain-containing protein, partial [Bacteroidota bacterium]